MYSYPYDPTGKAESNRFNEEHIVTSDENNLRVIRLKHAPFFRPLTITYGNSDTPLIEGVDFEYAYELVELDDCIAGPVFMGVNLINPHVLGSVRFSGNHLGGTYYAPYFEMMDDLIKHLNNPVSASWLSLLGRPALMPPMSTATSWDDLLNKKYLASAIRELKVGAEAGNAIIKAKLEDLKKVVDGIYKDIVALNYPSHQEDWNPHETTAEQINAHPEESKVPDAMLAYGKSLQRLTADIRALGLQQSEIDKYIAYNCCKDVSGTFVQMIAANRPLFRSPAGETELIFTDTSYELRSNGSVVVAVGVNLDDQSESYIEWVVGSNKLRISSSGDSLGMASLTLNGAALLNGVTIQNYQAGDDGAIDPDNNKLYISGVGINFTGKGSKDDPVRGELIIPRGTTTSDGAAKMKSAPGTETSGFVAATDAVAPYQQQQANFVIKETRINDQPMTGNSLNIDKAVLDLGDVNNTADADKPLSAAQRAHLATLAPVGHTHDWNSLFIPQASNEVHGISKYAATTSGLAELKAVAPVVLVDLAARADALRILLQNTSSSTVTDFATVDESSWLVNSSKTGISVQDMRYFYLLSGERKEGRASGTINLDTTPMFNWYYPSNNCEKLWGSSVLHDTQFEMDLGELPTCARTVGRSKTEMGALAYTPFLFKERVMVHSGLLNIRCQAGGKITIYIGGSEIASGNDYIEFSYVVDSAGIEETVAIRIDPDTPSKPAAAWFDILDGTFTMAYSQPGTLIGTLSEFYNPFGMRHYLYLNMRSGSLFSRAEPAIVVGIDLSNMLLGYVDVPKAGLIGGARIPFPSMIDYGEFSELEGHSKKILVHKPTLADYGISDAPAMRAAPIVDANPRWNVVRLRGVTAEKWGYVDMRAEGTPDLNSRFQIGFTTESTHPAHWTVPQNPQENGSSTIDGVFMVNVPTISENDDYGDDLWFFVSHRGNNPLAPIVRINPLRSRIEHSFTRVTLNNNVATYGETVLASFPTNDIVATMDVNDGWEEDLPNSALGFEDGEIFGNDWQLPRRIIVRYRYIPSTRTLRLCLDTHHRGVSKRLWREYVLGIDIAHIFKNGVVGLERKAVSVSCEWRLFSSWQPMLGGSAAELQDKFEFLPALMDGYCEFDNLTVPNAVAVSTTPESPQDTELNGYYWGGEYTEFVALPRSGGAVAHNHDMLWPACAQHNVPRISTPRLLTDQLWDYVPTDYKGGLLQEGFYIVATVPSFTNDVNVSAELTVNCEARVWLGTTPVIWARHPSGNVTPIQYKDGPYHVANADGVRRNRMVLQLFVPPGYVADSLRINLKLIFDKNGVKTEWEMTGNQDIHLSEFTYNVRQKNPWHLTQRVLELLRARVVAQKG